MGGIEDIKKHKFYENIKWEDVIAKKIKSPFKIESDTDGDSSFFLNYKEKDHKNISISKEDQKLFSDF
jgi:hypothetical protein